MVAVGEQELALQLNGTWYRFPVLGTIQPGLASPFPQKTVIGEYERTDEQLASSYIIEDLGGGYGVEIMDPKTQFDRVWDSTVWTMDKNQITLPPRVKEIGSGTVTGSKEISAGTQFAGAMYVAFADDVRKLESSDVLSANLRSLGSTATDAITFANNLYFAYSTGHDYFNGSVWTTVAGSVDFFAPWDSKLWKIDRNGANFASSIDGVAWLAKASIPGLENGDVRGLEVYFTPDNALHIHAVTKRGLWVYDATADVWRQTMFQHARHPYGGDGHAVHRDALYSSAGLTVYKFNANSVTNVGLDRDYGLPSAFRGRVRRLFPSQNWLVGLVDASQASPVGPPVRLGYYGGVVAAPTSSGFSALYLYNDRGWHYLWRSGSSARPSAWAGIGDAYSDYRLYFGNDGKLYYIKLSVSVFNPLQSSDARAWGFAERGSLVTPWFPGTITEMDKVGLRLRLRTRDTTATENVALSVGYDLDEAFTLVDTATSPGRREYFFGERAGRTFDYIRLRFDLARGSDMSKTPALVYAALKYIQAPDVVWGLAATLDLSESVQGLTPRETIAVLEQLAALKTLIPTAWRDSGGTQHERYMRLTRLVGQELAGPDGRGRWMIALTEV